MKRREFIENACKMGAGVLVGGVLFDLVNVPRVKARSRLVAAEIREIPLNLIDTPELKDVGGSYHLEIEDLDRDILVAHVTKNMFVAVDIKCTHRGCDVTYEPDKKEFVCPCHNSVFDLSGAPTKGPAKKPLNWYHAELKGDEVMVTVYGPNDPVPANCIPVKDSLIVKDTVRAVPDSLKIESDPFNR